MSGDPASRIMMRAWGQPRPLSFDARGDGVPLINSALHAWPGVPFELHRTQPTDEPWDSGPLEGEAHLRVVLDGGFDVTVRAAQRELRRHVGPGSLTLHVRSGTVLRVAGSAQVFALGLSHSWLQRLLPDVAPDALREYAAPAPDPSARALAQAMCEAVAQAEPCSALFAESVSLALLGRVLERLPLPARLLQNERSDRVGLSPAACRRLREHIDACLQHDLSLVALAALCGLRPRHFGALFTRAFGATPHRYVLQRRLALGARLLGSGQHEIADVAIRTGFCSQSHFTTAFRRSYGVTPARFAAARRVYSLPLPASSRKPGS
ncbi:MAG TPA: AraC family transcriptional regulator [Polyangiales bacterium]|nr:AraC family transcriptional regulator [Polyangiales bacterium]